VIPCLHFIRLDRCSHLRKSNWQNRLPRDRSRQWWVPLRPFMTQIPHIRTSYTTRSTVGSHLDIARILEKNLVAVVVGPTVENLVVQGVTVVVDNSLVRVHIWTSYTTRSTVGSRFDIARILEKKF